MSIEIGENPEGFKGINKFIAQNGEGHRGKVVAIKTDKSEAIILAMNTSLVEEGGVKWGKLYLVKEVSIDQYPQVIKTVNGVPNTEEWEIL